MNERIQKYTTAVAEQLEKLVRFNEAFNIPDGIGWADVQDDSARFSISLTSRLARDKERALQFAGDTFGRDGWTAKQSSNRDSFDWTKIVNGVVVNIYDAETMPPRSDSIPVPPSKFPIQLAEVSE